MHRDYRRTGEALHFAGALFFLGNIALVGQVYHLSSRPPNAFLLWSVGIVALPWLLRSKALHVLSLLAFGIWFGFEINQTGSLLYFGEDERQLVLYALLGVLYLCGGYCLRGTSFTEFAPATEKLGLLLFLLFAFPLTWGIMYHQHSVGSGIATCVFPVMAVATLAAAGFGLPRLRELDRQWRWTWGLAIAGAVAMLAGEVYLAVPKAWRWDTAGDADGYHWLCAAGFFVFALLQIQSGVQSRSEFAINSGVVAIGADIVAIYIGLVGSMGRTGLVFVLGGLLLLGLGIWLERKRRQWMQRIRPRREGTRVEPTVANSALPGGLVSESDQPKHT